MKKVLKITLITIAIVFAVMILAIVIFFAWAGKQPMVKDGYYNDVQTSAPLEQKYTEKGNYEVSYYEQDANNKQWKKFEIWYPAELETTENTYPLVVMVNGTGVAASKYKPIFDHLASWGFIVVGNEDESAGNGASASASLDYMLTLNSDSVSKIIARRVDTDHGDMLPYADGYMTAWFMYHLQGDVEAGTVFFGDNAEILNNANWQDVEKNI